MLKNSPPVTQRNKSDMTGWDWMIHNSKESDDKWEADERNNGFEPGVRTKKSCDELEAA